MPDKLFCLTFLVFLLLLCSTDFLLLFMGASPALLTIGLLAWQTDVSVEKQADTAAHCNDEELLGDAGRFHRS